MHGGNRFGGWLAPVLGASTAADMPRCRRAPERPVPLPTAQRLRRARRSGGTTPALEWGLMLASLAAAAVGILLGPARLHPQAGDAGAGRSALRRALPAGREQVPRGRSLRRRGDPPARRRAPASFLWRIVDTRVIDLTGQPGRDREPLGRATSSASRRPGRCSSTPPWLLLGRRDPALGDGVGGGR